MKIPLMLGPLEVEVSDCPWDDKQLLFSFTQPVSRLILPKKYLKELLKRPKG